MDSISIPNVFVPAESLDIAIVQFINADFEIVRVAMKAEQARHLARQLVTLTGIVID